MLLCVSNHICEDLGVEDIISHIEGGGYCLSMLLVLDCHNKSTYVNDSKVPIVYCEKSLEESNNLIELLLFFSTNLTQYLQLNEKLEHELRTKFSSKFMLDLFAKKSNLNVFDLTQIFNGIEFYNANSLEELAFKKQIKSVSGIYNFITQIPTSYKLNKSGFLDIYLNSSLTEKYFDDGYFNKIHESIDHFLINNKTSQENLNLLNNISNFYKINRVNTVKNIEAGLLSDKVVPELIWLSVHFYHMAKLAFIKKDYAVAFANTLRCLEYYLDFLFLYLGKYYTESRHTYRQLFIENEDDSQKNKEASGVGVKFSQLKKSQLFNFKSNLIKPIHKVIKLRNSSFFGHGLLIPDQYYAQMAIESVENFIIDIELQARYKGISWSKLKQELFSSSESILNIVMLDSFIDKIPYARCTQ